MGWGDADEAREGAENDARAGAEVPDGEDGGGPGAGGGQQEEEVVGDGGQLKYVSYMMANSGTNAGIAEATVAHLKARGVEPGGDLDTVVLGGEQTPLVTFWGVPQELIEKTEDVVVIGSDPRDSLMYGFEVPMNRPQNGNKGGEEDQQEDVVGESARAGAKDDAGHTARAVQHG